MNQQHSKVAITTVKYLIKESHKHYDKYKSLWDRFPQADWQHKFLVTRLNPLKIMTLFHELFFEFLSVELLDSISDLLTW